MSSRFSLSCSFCLWVKLTSKSNVNDCGTMMSSNLFRYPAMFLAAEIPSFLAYGVKVMPPVTSPAAYIWGFEVWKNSLTFMEPSSFNSTISLIISLLGTLPVAINVFPSNSPLSVLMEFSEISNTLVFS